MKKDELQGSFGDIRYNNRKALGVKDVERAEKLLRGVTSKRSTYETTAQWGAA